MRSGIYAIQNGLNSKVYIGSSKNLSRRKIYHFNHLRGNKSHCAHLQHAFNKYGESVFEFTVLEYCAEGELASREQYYLEKFRAADPEHGYNCITNVIRIVFSDEMRQKMSAARKGKPQSEEHKRNRGRAMSRALRGRKLTEEHKAKIRQTCIARRVNKGAVRSAETRQKISETRRLRGSGKGRKLSSEHREKLRQAGLRRVVPKHVLQILRTANIGRPAPTRKRIHQLKDDVVVAVWESIAAAALAVPVGRSDIAACLVGRRLSAKGFQWRLAA